MGRCAGRRRSRSRRRWPRRARDPAVRAALDAAVAAQNGTPGLPEPSRPCTSCSRTRPTGSPTGASRAPRSTTGASSTSTSWPACAWSSGEVFEATHRLLLRLIAEGKVQGVRIDHIDGLYDPRGYCQRLLSRVADVLAERRDGAAARDRRAPAAARSTSWSRRSWPAREPARGPAGRRHHRLRVHQPGQRPVRRSRRRALAHRHLSSLHRPGARVRRGGARRQAADPALLRWPASCTCSGTSSTASRSRAG